MTLINFYFFSLSFMFGFQHEIISETSIVSLDQKKQEITINYLNLQAENTDSAQLILNKILTLEKLNLEGVQLVSQELIKDTNQLNFKLVFKYKDIEVLKEFKFFIKEKMFILHPYENVEVNGVYNSSENFSKEGNFDELMKKMNFKQPTIEFKFSKRPHKFYQNYKSFTLFP